MDVGDGKHTKTFYMEVPASTRRTRHVEQKEDKSKTQAPHAKVKSRKQTKTLLLFEVSDWLRSSVRIFRTLSINAPSAHRVAVNLPLAAWYSIACSDCVCVDSEFENIEEGREVGPTPIHFDSWRAIGVVPRKRQKRERKSCQRKTALRRGEVRIFQRHQLVVLECPASLLSSASVTRGIADLSSRKHAERRLPCEKSLSPGGALFTERGAVRG